MYCTTSSLGRASWAHIYLARFYPPGRSRYVWARYFHFIAIDLVQIHIRSYYTYFSHCRTGGHREKAYIVACYKQPAPHRPLLPHIPQQIRFVKPTIHFARIFFAAGMPAYVVLDWWMAFGSSGATASPDFPARPYPECCLLILSGRTDRRYFDRNIIDDNSIRKFGGNLHKFKYSISFLLASCWYHVSVTTPLSEIRYIILVARDWRLSYNFSCHFSFG